MTLSLGFVEVHDAMLFNKVGVVLESYIQCVNLSVDFSNDLLTLHKQVSDHYLIVLNCV
jgi:hypothetical protein